LKQCSFDANFYTPDNRQQLHTLLERSILPSKGTLSPEEDAWETSDTFIRARRKHAAVESAIYGLEVHGLDRCPDHGLDAFQRYVALAVVARNIQQLGAVLQKRKIRADRRRRRKAA